MSYPNPIKRREKIDALTGIKSSLDKIRPVLSFVYLLYVANGRKHQVKYCDADGYGSIRLNQDVRSRIEESLGTSDLAPLLDENPMMVNQYEPLHVAITLLFKLGKLEMPGKSVVAERKGGLRFPKILYFSSNIVLLDLILGRFSPNLLNQSLIHWLKNEKSDSIDFEESVSSFLTVCSGQTEFKLRDSQGNEIFFQTEGVYSAIAEGKSNVTINGSTESVGPTRIYKNVIKDGLEPWITQTNNILSFTNHANPSAMDMAGILSTTLEINNVADDLRAKTKNNAPDVEEKWEQKVYFGTPGSGKSWKVKQKYEMSNVDGKYVMDELKTQRVVRTTFHPDMDYAQFVGCYKPIKDKTDPQKITYEFVPQAFVDAYVKAWTNTGMYYLIIEEINRGNCAQIFGDLFQLLDRDGSGKSEYPIKADHDLKDYLEAEFARIGLPDCEGIAEGKLCLPPNLSIIASMNTSDQSLFPMDSAFKRRWSWEYVPIDYKNAESAKNVIIIDGEIYFWHQFLRKVNDKIKTVTSSEDKQMGNFFIKCSVDEQEFCDKVMFYLWSEVGKDNYQTNDAIFKWRDEKNNDTEFSFNELYPAGAERTKILKGFMRFLEVKANDAGDE